MKKKNLQKISIRELADEADITRSTFYKYYNDPMEIIDRMQQEIITNIQNIIDETSGGDAGGFFLKLFQYLSSDDTKAEILSFDTGSGTGYDFIGNSIHNNYMLRWGQSFSGDQVKQYEYYRYYIVFGCIAIVRDWLKEGRKETPEQMAEIMASLLPKEKMYLKSEKKQEK